MEDPASAFDKPLVYDFSHGLGRKMYRRKDQGTLYRLQLASINRFECSRLLSDRHTRVYVPLRFA